MAQKERRSPLYALNACIDIGNYYNYVLLISFYPRFNLLILVCLFYEDLTLGLP